MINLPYVEYRALTEEGTNLFYKGRQLIQCPRKIVRGACSGINVFTPETWWSLGGNDEKFIGWGYEDTAMLRAHVVIKKKGFIRHDGIAFSLSHKEQAKSGPNYVNNQKLFEKYHKIEDPQKMIDFVTSSVKQDGQSFAMFFLGNGRKGYLERTIASWEANLIDTPKHQFIFDDSGDAGYVAWLKKNYSNYEVVAVSDKPVGQVKAIDFIFNKLKELDVDYILEIEEDWMLFRKIDIKSIIDVLEDNPNILQMRIPRTVWYSDYHTLDIEAGSLLNHHIGINGSHTEFKSNDESSWYEWRGSFYFWSHNPSLFPKHMLNENYGDVQEEDHELAFGKQLMKKYPKGVVGWWAENPYDAYIPHIGIRDDKLLKGLPNLRG
jgi:hypothetical protein